MSEGTKKTKKAKIKYSFKEAEKVQPQASPEPLQKSVEPAPFRENLDKKFDRNKIAFSAYQYANPRNVEEKNWERIDDDQLKQISQADPYISAIISKRSNQGSNIGRRSESKFDSGTRIKDLNPPQKDDFKDENLYKKAVQQRKDEADRILNFVLTCGNTDESLINTIFASGDQLYKKSSLGDYVSAQIRNLLTFGRCARYTIRNSEDIPVLFRPAPVETIYPILHKKINVEIPGDQSTEDQSIQDAKEYNEIETDKRPVAYQQIIEGNIANFLTDKDISMMYFQKQAYFGLRGYPLAPIEMAIYMVLLHQQTLSYLKNQFIKGITTKSILNIESTDPNYQISDEDLDNLRNQFHNYVLRTDNSAATPVIAGPVKVSVIPLTASVKDMEFTQLEDHIIRAICSAMCITSQEMGYGYLGTGNQGMTQSGKQEEIIRGEESGLRMLLDTIYDDLNQMLTEIYSGFADNFQVVYTGVGEDTRESVIQRSSQELNTTATMNSLLADSEKTDIAEFGGDVFLSPLFNQAVISKIKYGEFRYYYLKDKEALNNPAYDFIIDPNLQQAYQQLLVTPIKVQQELQQQQMQMQAQQQAAAQQQAEAQSQQDAQAQPQEEEQAPKKTLREKYKEQADTDDDSLNKSMSMYFEDWMKAHDETID